MKIRKKKGSSLVTVLAISVVLLTVCSTLFVSLTNTMKLNHKQKEREDLNYACESGIEIAKSRLKEKGTIDTRGNGNSIDRNLTEILKTSDKGGIVEKVEVFVQGQKLKSVAYHKDGRTTEELTVNLKSSAGAFGGSILENAMIGGDGGIDLDSNGSVTVNASVDSVGGAGNVSITGNPATPPSEITSNGIKSNIKDKMAYYNGDIEFNIKNNNRFTFKIDNTDLSKKEIDGAMRLKTMELKFKNTWNAVGQVYEPEIFLDGVEIGKITDLESIKDVMHSTILNEIKDKYVLHLKISGLVVNLPMDLVIINAERAKFIEHSGSCALNNVILICSDTLRMEGTNGKPIVSTISLFNSTMMADKIEGISSSSIHVAYQPGNVGGHGPLSSNEQLVIDSIINAIITPSSDNNSGDGSGNLVIEEGTYQND